MNLKFGNNLYGYVLFENQNLFHPQKKWKIQNERTQKGISSSVQKKETERKNEKESLRSLTVPFPALNGSLPLPPSLILSNSHPAAIAQIEP